jgi:hypothetical protein
LIGTIPKKSFNFDDLQNCKYTIIKQRRIRTRCKYDVDDFLNNIGEEKDAENRKVYGT